ncbi:MAG: efflux RND transporter permease subunit, partial [Planctomycetota bacterium]
MVQAFVRNPTKVAVGVLLLALFGTIALLRMPMQLTPEVQTPIITVETRWRGASPQEVEREVVQEQEEQLKGVEGVTKMSSECMDSFGRITLEFVVGTDMSEALLKVNTRLQQVREYPAEAEEPVLATARSSDTAVAWLILRPQVAGPDDIAALQREHPELAEALERARLAQNPGLRLRRLQTVVESHPAARALLPPPVEIEKLRRFAEDVVEARLERVPGVSNSNVFGGREEELQVRIDPARLAARRLTIADVRRALQGRNRDTSGGDFHEGKRRYVVRTLGQFRRIQDVEGVVLARRNDVAVYVRDVAEVRLGHKKAEDLVRNFGTPCIAINCLRETGANVVETMEGIRAATAELNAGALRARGLSLVQVYDETEYIHSAVGLVRQNIFIGGFLTICVLLLFLRSGRSTLVIALAIPSSVIGTFLLLGLMGRSLNVISLAGLAFAIGMLVDNAVVVLENVYRHYQSGRRRLEAAVRGTREVWGAVLASTLTTLAVFLPVLFVQEEAGQLFRDIALAISCSVGLSLLVSVTLIPTTTARLLARREGGGDGAGRIAGVLRGPLRPLDRAAHAFVELVVGFNAWAQRGVGRGLAVVGGLLQAAPATAQFGKNKIQYRDFEWKIYHSPHFDVYYYEAEADLLQKVVSFAESAYDHLSQEFDYQIKQPTP